MDRELTIAPELAAWATERIRRPRTTHEVRHKAGPAGIVTTTDEEIETPPHNTPLLLTAPGAAPEATELWKRTARR